MMTRRWGGVKRDRDKQAHSDLNYVWTSTSPLSDRENRKLWKLQEQKSNLYYETDALSTAITWHLKISRLLDLHVKVLLQTIYLNND